MNKQLEQYYNQAIENEIPVISLEGAEFIKQHIQDKNVKSLLEIGSAVGFSALFFAMETDVDVYTIERDEKRYKQMENAVNTFDYNHKITMVFDDATTHTMPKDYACDLLFIDAAKAQNKLFLEKYSPYVKPNGMIIIDNLIFHDFVNKPLESIESRNLRALVRKIITFRTWLSEQTEWDVTFYDEIGDGMAIITRGENE